MDNFKKYLWIWMISLTVSCSANTVKPNIPNNSKLEYSATTYKLIDFNKNIIMVDILPNNNNNNPEEIIVASNNQEIIPELVWPVNIDEDYGLSRWLNSVNDKNTDIGKVSINNDDNKNKISYLDLINKLEGIVLDLEVNIDWINKVLDKYNTLWIDITNKKMSNKINKLVKLRDFYLSIINDYNNLILNIKDFKIENIDINPEFERIKKKQMDTLLLF